MAHRGQEGAEAPLKIRLLRAICKHDVPTVEALLREHDEPALVELSTSDAREHMHCWGARGDCPTKIDLLQHAVACGSYRDAAIVRLLLERGYDPMRV